MASETPRNYIPRGRAPDQVRSPSTAASFFSSGVVDASFFSSGVVDIVQTTLFLIQPEPDWREWRLNRDKRSGFRFRGCAQRRRTSRVAPIHRDERAASLKRI